MGPTMKTFALLVLLAIFYQGQCKSVSEGVPSFKRDWTNWEDRDTSLKKECFQQNVYYGGGATHQYRVKNWRECRKLCKNEQYPDKCTGWTFWPFSANAWLPKMCNLFFGDSYSVYSIEDAMIGPDNKPMVAKFCGTRSGTLSEC